MPNLPSTPTEPIDFESAIIATAERITTAWGESGTGTRVPARTLEGSRIVWEVIYGTLRGRVPYPVPPDLMGVSVSAGLRVCKGFTNAGTVFLNAQGGMNGESEFRPWNGFLIPERVALNRYRQRTA